MYINTNHSVKEVDLNVQPATLEKTLLNLGLNIKIINPKKFIRAIKSGKRTSIVSYNTIYKAYFNIKLAEHIDIRVARKSKLHEDIHPNDIYLHYRIMKFQEKNPNLNIQSIVENLIHYNVCEMKDIAISLLKNYVYYKDDKNYFNSLDINYLDLDLRFKKAMVELFIRTSLNTLTAREKIKATFDLREVLNPYIYEEIYEFLLNEYNGNDSELKFTITEPENIINLNKLSPEEIYKFISIFHRYEFPPEEEVDLINKLSQAINDIKSLNRRVSLSELDLRMKSSQFRHAISCSINTYWLENDILANSDSDEIIQLNLFINDKSLEIKI